MLRRQPNAFWMLRRSYVTSPATTGGAQKAAAAVPPNKKPSDVAPSPNSDAPPPAHATPAPEVITPSTPPPEGIGFYVVQPQPEVGKEPYWKRYVALARPHLPGLLASTLCLAVYSAATLAIPSYFGVLIDAACGGEMPVNTAMTLLGLFGVNAVSNIFRLTLVGTIGERIIHDLRVRLYRSLVHKESSFFDAEENMTGGLVQRVSGDTIVVGTTLSEALSNGTKNIFQMVGSMAVMLYLSTPLTGVIVIMLPPLAIIAGRYGKYVRRLHADRQNMISQMASATTERIGHIQMVKAFGNERSEVNLFTRNSLRVLGSSISVVRWNAAYTGFLHVGGYFTLYSLIYAGSMLVASHDLTAGTLFSFILYTVYCGLGIIGSTNFFTEMNKGFGASMNIFKLLDKKEEEEHMGNVSVEEIAKTPAGGSHVVISDVTFRYPTRPDVAVYDGLNLEIKPGCCTALIGASGGGKSTIVKLLLKLYTDYEGSITVDGLELRDFNDKLLRTRVGYVPQEPVLFNGTIAQNIAYGLNQREWDDPIDKWTMVAIIEATKLCNAHDFITALPDGYQTLVGEGGRSLSGGQKQRIAIARALVKNPTLLVLDEATSALDMDSEKIVQGAIEGIIKSARSNRQRAVVVITHRLSMLKAADDVVLLDKGRVSVQGSLEEVSKAPLFRTMMGMDKKAKAKTEGSDDDNANAEEEVKKQ
eukprot:PhM_4_TR13714/c0_g1_i1/m.91394/K05657/ABCB10; ATP-binding cassette, subfamily B (MDR/TAP), member 10